MKNKIFIVLFVIVLAGYASYCALAQYEFSQGQAAFKAEDWLTAWIRFDRVGGYKFALPSHSNEVLVLKDQSSLLVLGQSMREKGEYKEALDAYASFITLYPKAETTSLVNGLFPAVYMDWGNSLRGKSDFASAVEKFEVVTQEYAQSPVSASAKEAEAETYSAWGDALSKAKEYETAVEKYQTVLTKFPTQSAAQNVQAMLGDVYLQWADQLRSNKQQELALEKYNFIISNFKDGSSSIKAKTALAPTMLEWTLVLHQNREFEKEVEILRSLMADYKDKPEAQQASQKIVAAYDSLGRQLMGNKSFIQSMQTYVDARGFALDKDAQSLVDVGYEDAVQGLAYDTDKDGSQVISEALETACAGQPATSPAVGILKDGPGKGMVCEGSFTMPTDLIAFTPAQFKYVVGIEYTTTDIQSCPYTPSGGGATYILIRQRNVAKVTVSSVLTGKMVNTGVINGPAPESCPEWRSFSSQSETTLGDWVNEDDIAIWLKQVFR